LTINSRATQLVLHIMLALSFHFSLPGHRSSAGPPVYTHAGRQSACCSASGEFVVVAVVRTSRGMQCRAATQQDTTKTTRFVSEFRRRHLQLKVTQVLGVLTIQQLRYDRHSAAKFPCRSYHLTTGRSPCTQIRCRPV
jgi:hypothetical protein